jgi:hypothetical protein
MEKALRFQWAPDWIGGCQFPAERLRSGVLSAIIRVFTALRKAISEQLAHYYYISAFCIVHCRKHRKAVLCRP